MPPVMSRWAVICATRAREGFFGGAKSRTDREVRRSGRGDNDGRRKESRAGKTVSRTVVGNGGSKRVAMITPARFPHFSQCHIASYKFGLGI